MLSHQSATKVRKIGGSTSLGIEGSTGRTRKGDEGLKTKLPKSQGPDKNKDRAETNAVQDKGKSQGGGGNSKGSGPLQAKDNKAKMNTTSLANIV